MTARTSTVTAATYEDWLRAIGGAASALPAHTTYDGIRVEPLSPRAAAAPLLTRANAASWDIRQLHAAADPAAVNAAIHDDIAGGATSIALQLATPGQPGLPPRYDAIAAALEGVPLERVDVCFAAGDQYLGAAQCLMALWEATGRPGPDMRGAIHADPLGTLAVSGALEAGLWPALELLGSFASTNIDPWPNVRLLLADGAPYHDAGASEAQELGAMLATAVEYLRALSFEHVPVDRVLPHLTLGLAADADLFATIAKLRAARLLIGRVAEASGAGDAAGAIDLWARTSQRMLTVKAPHTNTLRNTIAALGAALGGADAITVRPHTHALGASDPGARRLARSTHLLLKDESSIARVLDPAAGSGTVAALTQALAERAWTLFQEIEAAGGMAKSLLSGKVQAGIAKTAAARAKDAASGTLVITGVTAYAVTGEATQIVTSHPPAAPIEQAGTRIPPMPVLRLSEPFETDNPATE